MPNGIKRDLGMIYEAAIDAVRPHNILSESVIMPEIGDIEVYKKIYVVSFGKAAYQMAAALAGTSLFPVNKGIVITRYGHSGANSLDHFEIFEAAHPIPDENGVAATEKVIDLLKEAGEDTLVICLISGGASALLVAPCDGINLDEKQAVTDILMKSGADIGELNTVRKHLSGIKGGRLAQIAYPARVLSLVLSDVVGDKLDIIGSGPTSPDFSTYDDALSVLRKTGIYTAVPPSIISVLKNGKAGLVADTPKENNPVFRLVRNIIVGNSAMAIEAARKKAFSLGYAVFVADEPVTGEASDAGRNIAKKALGLRRNPPETGGYSRLCLISGGETTVTVRGKGTGGRNMELALAFAGAVEGAEGIFLLSAGTDGTDGATDAAGAFAEGATAGRARKKGFDPDSYLKDNNSYAFFRDLGDLFVTGPTGVNVMDIQIAILK